MNLSREPIVRLGQGDYAEDYSGYEPGPKLSTAIACLAVAAALAIATGVVLGVSQ